MPYEPAKLLGDPAYNVKLGAAHLGDLIAEYNGSYVLTLVAYNAGPRRVREWLAEYGDPRGGKVDPIDWVESIPFQETRQYVQKVLQNTQVYRARLAPETMRSMTADLKRGLVMALMLAGLRGIDDEIWRAARIDGIPKWRTYIQIVLPMMRPVLITTFVIVASGAVRVYDLVVALTQGGPGLSSQVPTIYVYETMFVGALAQGTAASSIMLLATAIILIPWVMVEFGKRKQG
jgi:hypothetical protein